MSERRGALLVAAAATCWSTGGLIVRLVSTDAWTTNLWRGLFASAFFTLVVLLGARGRAGREWRRMGWPGVAVALGMAAASTFFVLALARTSVANTLILMSVGPYITGLLGWLLMGERVRGRTWVAMAVALAGTVVMVSSSWARGAVTGDLLALGMAASFALSTVMVRRHPEIPMTPAAALAGAFTFLVVLPMASPLTTPPRDVALLALFGVGQLGVGFLLFAAGARRIPAAETSLIGMLETVLGPLWVWLFIGERPATASLVGGGLILGTLAAHAALDLLRPPPRPGCGGWPPVRDS